MRRCLNALYDGAGIAAAVCLAGICVLMLAQAAGRELGVLVRGADDITAWLCAASAFLALAHTFRKGELIRVGLWLEWLKPESRRRVERQQAAVRRQRLQARRGSRRLRGGR
mgnify:CR=1 FL=1